MTQYEYVKALKEREERNNLIQHIMIKYHMTEQDALRFYWERIYDNGSDKIYKEGRKKRNK